MDYGSIKNKLLIHATCVNLMIVILSKASQTKKNHCVADWLALSIHLALCAMLPRDKSSKGSDIFQVKFQILNSIPLSLVSLRKSAEIFDFIIPQIPKHKRSPKRTLLKKSNRRLSRKHPGVFLILLDQWAGAPGTNVSTQLPRRATLACTAVNLNSKPGTQLPHPPFNSSYLVSSHLGCRDIEASLRSNKASPRQSRRNIHPCLGVSAWRDCS